MSEALGLAGVDVALEVAVALGVPELLPEVPEVPGVPVPGELDEVVEVVVVEEVFGLVKSMF